MSTGETPTTVQKQPFLSNEQYDLLKRAVQYWLPAFGTFYFALAVIWGLPYGEQVVGSIAALTIFLGVVLGFSTARYNSSDARYDGEVVVTGNPENPHTLVFNQPLTELEGQRQITLKVSSP